MEDKPTFDKVTLVLAGFLLDFSKTTHEHQRFHPVKSVSPDGTSFSLDMILQLTTSCGGLIIRVAKQGFTALATFFWTAVDLHAAVMPRICEALGRQHTRQVRG